MVMSYDKGSKSQTTWLVKRLEKMLEVNFLQLRRDANPYI